MSAGTQPSCMLSAVAIASDNYFGLSRHSKDDYPIISPSNSSTYKELYGDSRSVMIHSKYVHTFSYISTRSRLTQFTNAALEEARYIVVTKYFNI